MNNVGTGIGRSASGRMASVDMTQLTGGNASTEADAILLAQSHD
jgi:hypothetical protein